METRELVKYLSKQLTVRPLCEQDIDAIYTLCLSNLSYYERCPPLVTKDSIRRDMELVPPGKDIRDKLYLGYFEGVQLVAIMDLVVGYPDQKTVFIGLLMVDKAYQRKGIGSAILAEASQVLAALGFERLRLGWIEGNQEAEAFWLHNHFQIKGETTNGAGLATVMAVRSLLHQETS